MMNDRKLAKWPQNRLESLSIRKTLLSPDTRTVAGPGQGHEMGKSLNEGTARVGIASQEMSLLREWKSKQLSQLLLYLDLPRFSQFLDGDLPIHPLHVRSLQFSKRDTISGPGQVPQLPK